VRYLLLVYAAGEEAEPLDTRLALELAERGGLVAAHDLEPVTTATSVRVRGGSTHVADGPFAETGERLGGVYVVDLQSLDEAIAVAARVPAAREGVVEIRPVVTREAAA
jgi:hypothetical protein